MCQGCNKVMGHTHTHHAKAWTPKHRAYEPKKNLNWYFLCVYSCVYVIQVNVHNGGGEVEARAVRGAGGKRGLPLPFSDFNTSRQGFSWNQKLSRSWNQESIILARQAGWPSNSHYPQCWSYRHTQPCPYFHMGVWDLNSGPCVCRVKHLYPLSNFLSP